MDFPDFNHEANTTPSSHFEYVIEKNLTELSKKDPLKELAFNAMNELEGWCTKLKASEMIDLVLRTNAQVVVEVGVWGGKSLIPMVFALKYLKSGKAYGIDPWDSQASAEGMTGANEEWWSSVNHEKIYQGLVEKIAKFKLEGYVELLRCTAADAPLIENIDVLHIDGNHSEEASFHDVLKFVPLVKSGGFVVFDDINWASTNRAVEWLDANCQKIAQYDDSSVWGIWQVL